MSEDSEHPMVTTTDRQTALELAFVGMAMGIGRHDPALLRLVVEGVEFMRVYAARMQSPAVGAHFDPLLGFLRAMRDGETPSQALSLLLLMNADAAPHQRDALQTWIAQATSEELGSDISDLMQRLRAKAAPSPPAKRKPRKPRK